MSNKTRRIKKEINNQLMFEEEMYFNLYGSFIICAYMFSEPGKYSVADINKVWRNFMKGKVEFPTFSDDKEWYGKLLNVFGMEMPSMLSVAFVQSEYNALFAPYFGGQVLPLREDGVTCRTLESGKVYPIEF